MFVLQESPFQYSPVPLFPLASVVFVLDQMHFDSHVHNLYTQGRHGASKHVFVDVGYHCVLRPELDMLLSAVSSIHQQVAGPHTIAATSICGLFSHYSACRRESSEFLSLMPAINILFHCAAQFSFSLVTIRHFDYTGSSAIGI